MENRSFCLGDLIKTVMAEISRFESRSASLSCTSVKFYGFITDLRNFGRFIPADIIKNWEADETSCKFIVSGLGDLKLNLAGKEPFSLAKFEGNALMTIDFVLSVIISEDSNARGKVTLVMDAELNPIMKMMASGPIEKFLETLVNEMEQFENWDSVV
jgi:carbon monoxide dehydrogenase subunit G